MNVGVGAVGHVQAEPFHPVSKRKLPEKELARALRKGVVEDLHVLAVRSVVAHLHAADQNFTVLAIVGVERVIVRPLVVGLPGVVAALEKKVGGPIVAN